MKKPLKVLLAIVCALIVLIGVVVLGFRAFFRIGASDYYKNSRDTFEIPNLNTSFVPQGFAYDANSGDFLTCGYDSKGGPSTLVVIPNSGETKTLTIQKDGRPFTGHLGGCEINGDYVYITGDADASIYVLNYSDIAQAADGDTVQIIGGFGTKADENKIGAAFVTKVNDELIIGEFYKTPEYETDASHKLTTKHGDYNQALAFVFKLDDQAEFGINKAVDHVISLPDQVQGLAYADGKYYVSTSWGLNFSYILVYDENLVEKQDGIECYGKTLPLVAFDGASLVDTIEAAPMSEEMVIVDGELYVMSESASNKYIFGKLLGANLCRAMKVE